MSDIAVTIVETPVGDNEATNEISSVESTSNAEELIVPDISTDGALKDVNPSDLKLDEEQNDDQSKDSSKSESGFVRPPYIPPHLMGRDLNNPASDMVGTGRRVQKPRLGVKVPYRNLTSQIVSQDEIAQEILERSLRKYSYSDVPEGGDVFFAMKLTHRLANKINNVETASEKVVKKVESKNTVESKTVSEIDKRPKKPLIAPTLPKVTSKKDDPLFDSKAEELYAEISSTLNEDCKLPKSLKASPVPNIAPKKVVNGSVVPPAEQELDNDTLLAILEGTTDLSDNTSTTAVVPCVSSTPPAPVPTALAPVSSNPVPAIITAISPTSGPCTPPLAPKNDGSVKRKRRVRPVLDPNIEKELALKQLMDFETKRSLDRMKRVIKKPKSEEEPQNVIENKQSEGEPEKKITVKRAYSLSSAPKRFPKKYQRIIKRQLRSSKLKAKSLSPDQPQKKLPEVPEVQIAIDKYIKTYTNKRKHKPDNGNIETPIEKKTKETNSDAATTSKSVENMNAKQEMMPIGTDSADENRNEANISDLEAKKSDETPKPKANSKVMREINRLLGDEGAINMIYSIEQKRIPGNRNDASVLPSTRRKKKDLLLKTKLVKSAVLRLSMSSSQTSPGRGRRSSPEAPATLPVPKVATKASVSPLRKASIESVESSTSDVNSPKTRKVAAEASKIIRRHSSSSAYSTDEDEPEKTSIANNATKESGSATQTPTPNAEIVVTTNAGSTSKASEKMNVDSTKTNDAKGKSSRTSSRRTSKEDPPIDNENLIGDYAYHASVLNGPNVEIFEQISLKEITIRKYDNLVQIIVISSSTKVKNALNADTLRELTKVLLDLQKDSKCRIVLLTSTGSSFCQGIDLQALINTDKKERSKVVNEYVHALTEFTKCLSQFHKLLIAGVHGSAVGLGVTMLPFFDMVFASDKATFYTPYVKLGQIPEAGATLTLPHLLGNAVTSELIFGCRMLTASEALQFGLVTRVLWPDKFNEELLPLARSIASHSSQSMVATKKLLRQAMNAKLVDQLETEAKLLQEHWCSEECQNLFKKYLEEEAMLQNK